MEFCPPLQTPQMTYLPSTTKVCFPFTFRRFPTLTPSTLPSNPPLCQHPGSPTTCQCQLSVTKPNQCLTRKQDPWGTFILTSTSKSGPSPSKCKAVPLYLMMYPSRNPELAEDQRTRRNLRGQEQCGWRRKQSTGWRTVRVISEDISPVLINMMWTLLWWKGGNTTSCELPDIGRTCVDLSF